MLPRQRYGTIVRFLQVSAIALLALSMLPMIASAQPPPPATPIAQSAEFATVRAKFENMTPDQVKAAGYAPEPVCVSSPLGGMGFHAMNKQVWDAQFQSGKLDAQTPALVMLDGNNKVVGVEWEASQKVQPAPVLFGQTLTVQPGHPGVEEPHYMLHAYFKPNGQVLFGVFDPQLKCPAAPAGAPSAAPTTGGNILSPLWMLLGLALLFVGWATRRLAR